MTQYSLLVLFIEYIAEKEMLAKLGVNERDKRPIKGLFSAGTLTAFLCVRQAIYITHFQYLSTKKLGKTYVQNCTKYLQGKPRKTSDLK